MHTKSENRRSKTIRPGLIFSAVFLALLIAGAAYGQEATARIIGTVTDPQGAIIPDAKVTITNAVTKVTYPTLSLKDGSYQIFSLPIGSYFVTVEKDGFKTAVSAQYNLEINQVQRVDIKMEVGSVTEKVEISAGASQVETVNSTIGDSITARPLQDLPLNGRNALNLALLLPGVMPNNPGDTSAGFFNIGGGRADSVTFLLDGGLNNDLLDNGIVYNPNPDALQEFRILKSDYGAEYGRNGGGIVSEVIKSGTNQIHGTAYEFLRNTDFDANSFFNNLNDEPRDVLKRSQFGGTLGGPIWLPKVFNGKDKAFWFFSYEGQRQTSEGAAETTTYTPAELKGNFSQADPDDRADVAAFLKAFPFFQPNSALAAEAIINPGSIDPIAQNYIKAGLIPTAPTGTLRSLGEAVANYDQFTTREDFNITDNDRLSFSGAAQRSPNSSQFGGADVLGYPDSGDVHTYFLNITYDKTISPTLFNEAHFNTQRLNILQAVPEATLPNASQLGMNIPSDAPTGPPLLSFNSGLSTGFSGQGPSNLIGNTFAWNDTFTWVKGRHTFKFGGYISPYQQNMVFDFFTSGDFGFSGPFGIGSGLPVADGGTATRPCQSCDLADFLFGLSDNYFQAARAPSNIRSTSTYSFAQDELKVNSRLTITVGLRYEYSTPKSDTQGRTFNFISGEQSQVFVNAPKGMVFPGDPGAPTGVNFADKTNFAPRFGFAYDITGDGKTSIRGGVGIYYDILKAEDNFQYNGAFPFESESTLFYNPFSTITGSVGILQNPFGAAGQSSPFPSKPPTRNISFANELPEGDGGVFVDDPHLKTPYVYQYSLSVQREVLKNLLAEADYIGSSSHKLTSLIDANPFIPGTLIGAFDGLPRGTNFGF
ncbi:MAG TPA: TonB-dependent receptor, partial [Blastocatellia bacterium]